jgi:hypothetical protein
MAYHLVIMVARLLIFLRRKPERKSEDLCEPDDHHVFGVVAWCKPTFVVWGAGMVISALKGFQDMNKRTTAVSEEYRGGSSSDEGLRGSYFLKSNFF